MNAIVLHMMLSLDGFFEGPDGSLAWHRVDEELHQYFNDVLSDAGAFVSGRVNYELMESYWPHADKQPDAAAVEVEFAGIWKSKPKVVFSTTMQEVGDNATLYSVLDADALRQLRDSAPGDLVVGGAVFARALLDLDLIDEFRLFVNPVTVGEGRRLFEDGADPHSLRLLESRQFGNGVVMLRYSLR